MKIYQVDTHEVWYKENQLCFIISIGDSITQPLWVKSANEYHIAERPEREIGSIDVNIIYKERE